MVIGAFKSGQSSGEKTIHHFQLYLRYNKNTVDINVEK